MEAPIGIHLSIGRAHDQLQRCLPAHCRSRADVMIAYGFLYRHGQIPGEQRHQRKAPECVNPRMCLSSASAVETPLGTRSFHDL